MIMLIMLMIIVLLYLIRSLPEKIALLFLADPGSTLWPRKAERLREIMALVVLCVDMDVTNLSSSKNNH